MSETKARAETQTRKCLRCWVSFPSWGAGNRLCERCRFLVANRRSGQRRRRKRAGQGAALTRDNPGLSRLPPHGTGSATIASGMLAAMAAESPAPPAEAKKSDARRGAHEGDAYR